MRSAMYQPLPSSQPSLRARTVSSAQAIAYAMPRVRPISALAWACGALATLYVVLMVTTVIFAAMQTHLASSIREADGNVADIESTYYRDIAQLEAADPAAVGFVEPKQVTYVAATNMPAVSYAGR